MLFFGDYSHFFLRLKLSRGTIIAANIGQAMVNLKLWLSNSSSSHRQLHGGRGLNSSPFLSFRLTDTILVFWIPRGSELIMPWNRVTKLSKLRTKSRNPTWAVQCDVALSIISPMVTMK